MPSGTLINKRSFIQQSKSSRGAWTTLSRFVRYRDPFYSYLIHFQACENQRECRDAAERLLDELEFFIELEPYAAGLGRKPLSKKAVGSMLLLVKQILEHICAKTKTGAMSSYAPSPLRYLH